MSYMQSRHKMKLKESQHDTLEILQKLDTLCKNLNITYWVMYGTLIGTIRHKGFIPWDDDFDVCMPRPDYDKFTKYFEQHDNDVNNLYLDNYRNDTTCFFWINRICDRDHELIFDRWGHKSGLFIDIYPFDGMGAEKDKEFWEKNFKKYQDNVKGFYMASESTLLYGNSKSHKILNIPYDVYSKIRGKRYFYKRINSISRKYSWDESKYVGLPVWATWLRFLKKEWFSETVYLPFENTTVPVPSGYDNILRTIYGDYMKLPPEEQRKPQHDYVAYKL